MTGHRTDPSALQKKNGDTMQEIKCPNFGEVFVVDESGYAQIVQQIRDKEFEKELRQREKESSLHRGKLYLGTRFLLRYTTKVQKSFVKKLSGRI